MGHACKDCGSWFIHLGRVLTHLLAALDQRPGRSDGALGHPPRRSAAALDQLRGRSDAAPGHVLAGPLPPIPKCGCASWRSVPWAGGALRGVAGE